MKNGMTKYSYSELHISKLSLQIQEVNLLCGVAKLQAVQAELRKKQSIFQEANQRLIPQMTVQNLVDKSGKLGSLSGWEQSLSTIMQIISFAIKQTFKISKVSAESTTRTNLGVTPAHRFVTGMLHSLDYICRDLHFLFSGDEVSLASVIQEILQGLSSTIKMPHGDQSTRYSSFS